MPLAVICVVLCGLVYVAVQQNFRMSANDPQIQIAEDVTNSLSAGNPVSAVFAGNAKIDVAKSLATFAMAFDSTGKVLTSTASLDGQTPVPPKGVLDGANKTENRLTWQPKPTVRIAAVVIKYQTDKESGYVLVGRNMREVENRESQLTLFTVIGLLASLLGSLIVIVGLDYLRR